MCKCVRVNKKNVEMWREKQVLMLCYVSEERGSLKERN